MCTRDNMHAYLRPSSFISDKKVSVSLFGVEQHEATGHACSIICYTYTNTHKRIHACMHTQVHECKPTQHAGHARVVHIEVYMHMCGACKSTQHRDSKHTHIHKVHSGCPSTLPVIFTPPPPVTWPSPFFLPLSFNPPFTFSCWY